VRVGSSPTIPTNYSPIAQLVERLTVNQNVRGSSPRRGAKFNAALAQLVEHITSNDEVVSSNPTSSTKDYDKEN